MGVGSVIYQLSAACGGGCLFKRDRETLNSKMLLGYRGCREYPGFEFVQGQEGVKPGVVDVLGEFGLERGDSIKGILQSLGSGQPGEVVWQSIVVDQSSNVGIAITQEPSCVASYLAVRSDSTLIRFAFWQFLGPQETRTFRVNAKRFEVRTQYMIDKSLLGLPLDQKKHTAH